MAASANKLHLGFLAVAELDGTAFVGGLLVTNHLGRPLEFQCTMPVRPNKTQEILYGDTLRPFVFSELLGKTLLERVQVKPQWIIVSQPELLALREHVDIALACLADKKSNLGELLSLGSQFVAFHPGFTEDRQTVAEHAKLVNTECDLQEPLDRVRDALQETVRAGAVA